MKFSQEKMREVLEPMLDLLAVKQTRFREAQEAAADYTKWLADQPAPST